MKQIEQQPEYHDIRPKNRVPIFAGGVLIDPPHSGTGAHEDFRIYGPNGVVSRIAFNGVGPVETQPLLDAPEYPSKPDHDRAA